ncbi:hypothetical protein THRCLA_21453 [Thraustotheca clavata]|uniref:Uncharacterized protein n=1 Tax=Thraustotheca clavata TaxID=74557 RepID=A0A1V9ZW95_9STRA|nr:hypothetical protein THRCLA_21453 [Thraustotheca clavata]
MTKDENWDMAFAKFIATITDTGPSLQFVAHDEWQLLKLSADPEARLAAIHAIVDREYYIMDSVFIDLGVIDENRVTERVSPKLPISGEIDMYIGACQRMKSTLFACVPRLKNLNQHQYSTIEVIDESTLHVLWTYSHSVGDFQFRSIVKRYLEPNKRCVFVSRTILEDEAIPLNQNMRDAMILVGSK